MRAAEWTDKFGPFDEDGRPIPIDGHPLTVAVRANRAGHFLHAPQSAEGDDFEVGVGADHLVGTTGFEGAMLFFWPARRR